MAKSTQEMIDASSEALVKLVDQGIIRSREGDQDLTWPDPDKLARAIRLLRETQEMDEAAAKEVHVGFVT